MPSTKRLGDLDDGSASPNKFLKLETASQYGQHHAALQQQLQLSVADHSSTGDHGNGSGSGTSSSGSSKKRVGGGGGGGGGASTRTGQACDRCKIRKIRCDARPGGCSPCLQNNSECKTTDRITGRATSRGHTEVVESENTSLKMYLLELQQQLKDNGIEPKAPTGAQQGYMATANASNSTSHWPQQSPQSWDARQTTSHTPPVQAAAEKTSHGILPEFRTGCIGDNYLGVSSENNWLSPIEGTSLALFGAKIDLAEFMPAENDHLTSAMSYRNFISHAYGKVKPFKPTMPPYEQLVVYAEWYFRVVQSFTPILHRADFMQLLDRIHHQSYQPSSAESVMVHMVLAILMFQFSARNGNEQARQDSMAHYQYAVSFVPDLITGHKLEDIQALVLICALLRNQPRPAAAWMFTNFVMGLAIESGLHRSAKAWQGSRADFPDAHHLEMRKRTFWTLLLYHVNLSGKLGRPMPLKPEDFDIEMPEPLADTDASDGSSTKPKECSFSVAIEGYKLCRIAMMIYSTIYAVKSNGQYEANVRKLDKELADVEAQLPLQFKVGPSTKDEDRVNSLYIEMCIAELRLLVHHPSLCGSAAPQIMQSNLNVCLEWSGRLLNSATSLKELKSLDTTWLTTTNFLAAIFTTLFAFTERRDQITSAELQKLRQDMDAWMEVIKEVSMLLGTLPQLQVAVRQIIDTSIENIARHLAAKTASAAVSATLSSPIEPQSQRQGFGNGFGNSYTSEGGGNPYGQGYSQSTSSYANTGTYGYAEPQSSDVKYPSGTNFDANAYTSEHEDLKPTMEAQLTAHDMPASRRRQSQYLATTFASPHAHSSNTFSPPPVSNATNGGGSMFQNAGPAAWRYFADTMVLNVHSEPSSDYPANMMALGMNNRAHEMSGTGMENIAATLGTLMDVPREYEQHAQVWPLMFSGGIGQ